jgi:hypothetical protein
MKKARASFLKKKKQKTFAANGAQTLRVIALHCGKKETKVSWFFF